jgi:hypothetical protein
MSEQPEVLDRELALRLEATLATPGEPDWLDVERRAARHVRSRRRLGRPGLLAAALVIVGGGGLALGVGRELLDDDVPAAVNSDLHRMGKPSGPLDGAPPWVAKFTPGRVVKGSAHTVMVVQTSRGQVTLYSARTVKGQACHITQFRNQRAGGCFDPDDFSAANPIMYGTQGLGRSGTLIFGYAPQPDAASVALRRRGASTVVMPLTEHYFMQEVPGGRRHELIALDVVAADDRVIATQSLIVPKRHFTQPTPQSVKLLASEELPNGGGTVTIWSGRDAQGQACFRHLRNGRSQRRPVWECLPETGHWWYLPRASDGATQRVPVRWELGLLNDGRKPRGYGHAYATGWVAPNIDRLSVLYQNGESDQVTLHDRYFLFVVPQSRWPASRRPSWLIARDAAGSIVYRQFLYPRQHCIYPGPDPLCRKRGVGTG